MLLCYNSHLSTSFCSPAFSLLHEISQKEQEWETLETDNAKNNKMSLLKFSY